MIGLPDVENRVKIPNLILCVDDMAPNFAVDEVAAAATRYSGSDLKVSKVVSVEGAAQNLSTTAAYSRIP